ncbi:MAG: hypothetical protein ACKVH0_14970 [Alphaproteobacteria bacterium]
MINFLGASRVAFVSALAFLSVHAQAADDALFRPTPEPSAPLTLQLADVDHRPDLLAGKHVMPMMAVDRNKRVGLWYAEGSFGVLNPGDFTSIMFDAASTTVSSETIAGVGIGREVLDLGSGFSMEAGLWFAHRIDEGGVELGLPVTFVFDGFPWRDKLPMRLRLAVGPSFISKITPTEQSKDVNNVGSKVLNMFNPEIEVGLPGAPEWSGFFRLHHRSGIFGLIDDVTGGSTYMLLGLKHRFEVDGY